MNVEKTAKEIKDLLVELANSEMLLDINTLSIESIEEVLRRNNVRSRLEWACDILCGDDDNSIEEQIKLIEACEDDTMYIDNIDGVVVWEKLEWSLTVSEFLEQIEER